MRALSALLLLALAPAPALAQQLSAPLDEVPEPPILEPTAPTEGAPTEGVSDQDVIRWASREIGRVDGRETGQRPPIPPDEYLRRSRAPGGGVALADHTGRDILRLLAELGLGSLGLGVGGGVAALVIWAVTEEVGTSSSWTAIAVMGGTALASMGLTSGVTLGADLSGGRGNFGQAFLGQLIGAAAALPLVVLALANDSLPAALAAAGALPLAGAILGYEIGHADAESGTQREPVLAFAAPTPGGAAVGVVGALP